ncbi:MAG: hypothetical protein SGPRY_009810 [Prymnesium sp.]
MSIRRADASGSLLGLLPLQQLIEPMTRHAAGLSPSRTPNIIKRALERSASLEAVANDSPESDSVDQMCTIHRHGNSVQIPWAWLTVALVIQM